VLDGRDESHKARVRTAPRVQSSGSQKGQTRDRLGAFPKGLHVGHRNGRVVRPSDLTIEDQWHENRRSSKQRRRNQRQERVVRQISPRSGCLNRPPLRSNRTKRVRRASGGKVAILLCTPRGRRRFSARGRSSGPDSEKNARRAFGVSTGLSPGVQGSDVGVTVTGGAKLTY